MDKEQILLKIQETGIVAVVRADSADRAKHIVEACMHGGIPAIEITFTVPKAHQVIEEIAKTYRPEDIILGAGTVLDSETARIALLSGAQYIVSPHFDEKIVKLCNRYRTAVMPGVMSVQEAVSALESGADILKIFPGDLFGPKIIKAFHGPLPQAKLMPTGGVSIDNVDEWIRSGAVAVGVGSTLTQGAQADDYDLITQTGKAFVEKIKEVRANK